MDKPHGNKKQFCKRGHDTAICGRGGKSICNSCEKERIVRRLALRPKKLLDPICNKGHNKDKVGRTSNGHCLACDIEIYSQKYAALRAKVASVKAWVDGIKMEAGCFDCGYNKSPVALHFDHLPGHEKKMDISNMVQHPTNNYKNEIMSEISKCEVVCSNCHAIRTHVGRKISEVA